MENFIHDIEIKNFKSIRQQTISGCNKINLFVGPPNVGKSNLIEALSFLSYLNNDFFTHLDKLCRFEFYTDLFNYGNVSELSYIEFNSNHRISLQYQSEESLHIEFQEKSKEHLIEWICVFGIDINKGDTYIRTPQMSRKELLKQKNEKLNDLKVFKYKFLDSSFDKTISAIHLDSPYGENLFEVIQNNQKIKDAFSELIKIYGFKMLFDKSSKRLKLFKELTDASVFEFSFNQIADTLQKLIFHLAACMSNKNSVLLLEEPEAHLYEPFIQEITNQVKYGNNQNQFFVVTHSQYVIDELLRDEESKKDTNIYLVGLENDSTSVKLLDPEKNQDVFHRGLNVFFNFQNLWKEN